MPRRRPLWREEGAGRFHHRGRHAEEKSTLGADAMHATKPLKKASFPGRGRWDTTPCGRANGGIAGRPDIRADVSTSKRFHFLGIPGRVFFKFDHGESLKKIIMVGVGLEPTPQKTHSPADDAISYFNLTAATI